MVEEEGSSMKAYIGAKIISAEPQAKNGQEGYRVRYPDGYVSWAPKETFEEAYRLVSNGEKQLVANDTGPREPP